MEEEKNYSLLYTVIIWVLIALCLIFGLAYHHNKTQLNHVQAEINQRTAKISKIKKYNQHQQTLENKYKDLTGYKDAYQTAQAFYNQYYNWDSWSQFVNSRKQIQKDFPQLKGNQNVNITGNDVGNGTSPDSSYKMQAFQSDQAGSLILLITQNLNSNVYSTTSTYFAHVHGTDKKSFNIDSMIGISNGQH